MSKRGREAKGSASILPLILLRKEKGGHQAALFCESVKIKGDKGVEKPLGESGLYCEGGTESVHSLPSSSLLYHMNLVLQACLNMNFKLPLYTEILCKPRGTSA